ncbi:hypothetical protein YG5714_0930 [Sulfolobus islandicus Y.G.57.14]|uniref:Uncharacterized protein n=1 Tax=Saccharolobus islandicus (strain Y.G.57.14 / Yellowstone \|nr:hypothetical protein YG5714_0930 [Sulfolobus islandicus Y.G.57.14]
MMFYGFMGFLVIPAFVLGIIGSLISDKTIAGVLLVLAQYFQYLPWDLSE